MWKSNQLLPRIDREEVQESEALGPWEGGTGLTEGGPADPPELSHGPNTKLPGNSSFTPAQDPRFFIREGEQKSPSAQQHKRKRKKKRPIKRQITEKF